MDPTTTVNKLLELGFAGILVLVLLYILKTVWNEYQRRIDRCDAIQDDAISAQRDHTEVLRGLGDKLENMKGRDAELLQTLRDFNVKRGD